MMQKPNQPFGYCINDLEKVIFVSPQTLRRILMVMMLLCPIIHWMMNIDIEIVGFYDTLAEL